MGNGEDTLTGNRGDVSKSRGIARDNVKEQIEWFEDCVVCKRLLSTSEEEEFVCIASSGTNVYLGTSTGRLVIATVDGVVINATALPGQEKIPIRCVSTSTDGNNLSILKGEKMYIVKVTEKRELCVAKAVDLNSSDAILCAIDPHYKRSSRNTGIVVCYNSGKFVEYSSTIFSSFSRRNVHGSTLPPLCLKWVDYTIVWADSERVYIFDAYSYTTVISVPFDYPHPTPSMRPYIHFDSSKTFSLCFENAVTEYRMDMCSKRESDNPNNLIREIRCTKLLRLPENTRVVSAHAKAFAYFTINTIDSGLHLKIMSDSDSELDDVYISRENFIDTTLLRLGSREWVFLVSHNTLVSVRVPTLLEVLEWIYDKKMYCQVLELGSTALKKNYLSDENDAMTLEDLFLKCVIEHMNRGEYSGISKIFSLNAKKLTLDFWVRFFISYDKLQFIMPYINQSSVYKHKETYNIIFQHLVKTDVPFLNALISAWPSNSLDPKLCLCAALHILDSNDPSKELLKLIARLYSLLHQHDMVFYYRLLSGDLACLDLVSPHNLFYMLLENVSLVFLADERSVDELTPECILKEASLLGLLDDGCITDPHVAKIRLFSTRTGISYLISHTNELSVGAVFDKISSNEKYLHVYLSALFTTNKSLSENYHHLQPRLYAIFDVYGLLPFLKSTSHYVLKDTYDLCNSLDLFDAKLFLLERISGEKCVLETIINELHDWKRAVEYAKSKGSQDVWDCLFSANNPQLLSELLCNAPLSRGLCELSNCVNDIFSNGDLKNSVILSLSKCENEISYNNTMKEVLSHELTEAISRLEVSKNAGIFLDTDTSCSICSKLINHSSKRTMHFYCTHSFHESCYRKSEHTPTTSLANACILCTQPGEDVGAR